MRPWLIVVGPALLLCACSSDPPPGRFACGSPADCPSGWVCECERCFPTAGGGGSCIDGGGTDAGPQVDGGCGGCDDGQSCTVDTCTATGCQNTPDNAMCPTMGCATGRCDLVLGCVYVLDDSMCPGDGNPCTVERCEESGCVTSPVVDGTACDDDVFCNGTDSCMNGMCNVHDDDPCPGTSTCDEEMQTCLGCTAPEDCPARMDGPWGPCVFEDVCATTGMRTRGFTTYSCDVNCIRNEQSESEPCSRPSTDGVACPTDGDPCTNDTCMGGSCYAPHPDNTACGPTPAQDRCCDGACVDLFDDDDHCGACGVSCIGGGSNCEQVDTGGPTPGGACSCVVTDGCPAATGWACRSNSCECTVDLACGGLPAFCGGSMVNVCRPTRG